MDRVEHARLLAGRYRLDSVIGRGGMGTVWRARDELLNRDVAVKEIAWPPSLDEAERQTARRRTLREAQMAARLRHPNVVLIYDIVEEDDRPWIVMEILPYRSLRDIVAQDGPLAPARAAELGLGILAALSAAHAEGVLHRDVKPANILLAPDGRAVLTDFGIARPADSPTLTGSGLLIGSPSYIAPERARGGRAGPAGDLWGLGASLYTAVEGRPPFEREGALPTLTAVVADEPDPATRAGALWPVISGLLRKDPARRLGPVETERMLRQLANDGGGRPRWFGSRARRTPDSAGALPWPSPKRITDRLAAREVPQAGARPAPPAPAPGERLTAPDGIPAQAPGREATASQALPVAVADLEASAPPTSEPEGHPVPVPLDLQGEPIPQAPQSPTPGTLAAESLTGESQVPGSSAPGSLPQSQGPGRPRSLDSLPPEAESVRPPDEAEVPEPGQRTAPQARVLAGDDAPPPSAPVSPHPLGTDSPRPASPRRRSRRTLNVLAAAMVVSAGAATAVALTLSGSPGHQAVAPPVNPRPSSAASGPASPSGSPASPSQDTATPSPTPSSSPNSAGENPGAGYGALPADYYRFTNSTGFSIGVPRGWQISRVGHYVYIRDPANSGVYLLIDQSNNPKPNPLADWRQQQASRESTYAGYHRIRLESVDYPQGEKAADWEFTYYSNGVLVHVLNRNVLANSHHAYALYWATPQSDWNADYHYFQAFAVTFRPAAP